MTSCPEARGWEFWWFLKKAVSWDLSLGETSWDWKLGEAGPVCGLRDARAFVGSVSWDSDSGPGCSAEELAEERCRNSQHSKNCVCVCVCVSLSLSLSLSLSPRVEKPKSQEEGNKRFVPELKKVVSVSGFLCMGTFYTSEHFTYSYHGYVTFLQPKKIIQLSFFAILSRWSSSSFENFVKT